MHNSVDGWQTDEGQCGALTFLTVGAVSSLQPRPEEGGQGVTAVTSTLWGGGRSLGWSWGLE